MINSNVWKYGDRFVRQRIINRVPHNLSVSLYEYINPFRRPKYGSRSTLTASLLTSVVALIDLP